MIAKHRADYYKDKDGSDWKEEFDFVMNDDYEGIDWVTNNMNLEDFEGYIKKIKTDKEVDWINPINSRIKDAVVSGGDDDK